MQVPAAAGIGQRRAVLLAAAALQEGHARAAEYAANEDLPAYVLGAYRVQHAAVQLREAAELRQILDDPDPAVDDLAVALEQAVVWSATTELDAIAHRFHRDHGLIIDPRTPAIRLATDFDTERRDRLRLTTLTMQRADTATDTAHSVLDTAALPAAARAAARAAVTRWAGKRQQGRRGERAWRAVSGARPGPGLTRLDSELDSAGVDESDRARIGFVAAYLTGELTDVDLTTAPLLVDPGEMIKGQVAGMLERRRDPTTVPRRPPDLGLPAPADRHLVRDQLARIDAGNSEHWLHLWPHHVDRPALVRRLHDYAGLVDATHDYADHLAEHPDRPIPPMVVSLLDETRRQRHELHHLLHTSRGLLDIERILTATAIEALDVGGTLPELLLVDEFTKAATERVRHHQHLARLCQSTDEQLTVLLARAGLDIGEAGESGRRLTGVDIAYLDVRNAARAIAHARSDPADARHRFGRAATQLNQQLARQGVDAPTRTAVDRLLTRHLDAVDALGTDRRARIHRWQDRLAAAVHDRDLHAHQHTIGVAIDDLLPDTTHQALDPGADPADPPPQATPPADHGPDP
ncbi:hypothetical protein [Nocardia wallacei]|uniref:hypothetical protein n=1 Tax=Nocardia wallacei TaxID=480035 RepID=UPI0024570BD3|nr:hypothetical protein [Nocardia wallacei]